MRPEARLVPYNSTSPLGRAPSLAAPLASSLPPPLTPSPPAGKPEGMEKQDLEQLEQYAPFNLEFLTEHLSASQRLLVFGLCLPLTNAERGGVADLYARIHRVGRMGWDVVYRTLAQYLEYVCARRHLTLKELGTLSALRWVLRGRLGVDEPAELPEAFLQAVHEQFKETFIEVVRQLEGPWLKP